MALKESRHFTLGMNSDLDDRSMPPGAYRSALNCIAAATDGEHLGTLVNEKGTTLNSTWSIEIGELFYDFTVIGSCENKAANSIIFFLHSSGGTHRILEWLSDSDTIEPILEPKSAKSFTTTFLNFSTSKRIQAAVFDDNIVWTDDYNPPRHINISSAKNYLAYTSGAYVGHTYRALFASGTTDQKNQFIEYIRRAPVEDPSIAYNDDSSTDSNFPQGKLWQFRYRYVYYDGSKSTFSPISEVSLPEDEDTGNALSPDNSYKNNYITISVDSGHSNVVRIELAFREGNTGTWYLIDDTIEKFEADFTRIINDFTTTTYDWYGQKQGRALSDDEANTPFHAVPLLAGAIEYTDSNRVFMGDYTIGYDNPEPDVQLSLLTPSSDTDYGLAVQSWAHPQTSAPSGEFYFLANASAPVYLCLPDNISHCIEGSVISGVIMEDDVSSFASPYSVRPFTYKVTASDVSGGLSTLATSISNAIGSTATTVTTHLGRTAIQLTTGGPHRKYFNLKVGNPLSKRSTWKRGTTHNFGIVYYDEQGRHGSVLTNDDMNLYIPFYNENESGTTYEGGVVLWNDVSFQIDHLPPSWATRYQIVYGGSGISFHMKAVFDGVLFARSAEENALGTSYRPDRIKMKMRHFGELVADDKYGSYNYTFAEGDRVRFITDSTGTVYTDLVDLKIYGYDATTQELIIEAFDYVDYENVELVEIYRPNPVASDRVYHEVSEIFDISGGYHLSGSHGSDVDQSSGVAATINLIKGDVHIIPRGYYRYEYYYNASITDLDVNDIKTVNYSVENMYWSDYYTSDSTHIGRPVAVVEGDGQKDYNHYIIHSGRYLQGAQLNNVFEMSLDDVNQLNADHGDVQRLIQVGFTLKIIQDRKISSAYLNRRQTFNAQGQEELVLTDDVVGTIRPSSSEYGCQDPDSVVRYDRSIFFWDQRNGVIVRDDANGADEITVGMSSFFRARQLAKVSDSALVVAGVDRYHGRVLFTFNHTSNPKTISYDVKNGVWRSLHSYTPKCYGSTGNHMISWNEQNLYTHNTNNTCCNFHGTQYEQNVEIIFNDNPLMVKYFLSIWVQSNNKWFAPDKGDVYIPADDVRTSGQNTRMVAAKFKYKEGVYYGSIPRDMDTPNISTEAKALIQGDRLRGQSIGVILKNDETQRTALYAVHMLYNKSELS